MSKIPKRYQKYSAAFALGFVVGAVLMVRFPNDSTPTTTVSNSAPPFALLACQNKQFADACEIVFEGRTITGVCGYSGDQLACGPTLPEQVGTN